MRVGIQARRLDRDVRPSSVEANEGVRAISGETDHVGG